MNYKRIKHILSDHIFDKEFPHWLVNYSFRPLRRMGLVPDEIYLKNLYRCQMQEELDLENPQTFSQKLQWLKLYYRKPEFTTMVDKYAVKEYVAERIGEEYIIPTFGVWDSFDEIDFDSLPEQFVLKSTNGSGNNGVVICTDKSKLDKKAAKKRLEKSMKLDCYVGLVEWPYHNVPRRIIAEKFMSEKGDDGQYKDLHDYKIFCFDGVAKALFIASDRQDKDAETRFDFFDADFRHLPFTNGHPMSDEGNMPRQPETFEQMKSLAEKLTKGLPHARVDFYEVNGKAYFGEITFYHNSGLVQFVPNEWDEKWGKMIALPEEMGGVFIDLQQYSCMGTFGYRLAC